MAATWARWPRASPDVPSDNADCKDRLTSVAEEWAVLVGCIANQDTEPHALGNCLKLDGRGRLSRNPPARPAATPHSVAARVGHCVGCRLCVGFRRLPTESPKVADRVTDGIEPAVSAVAHDASNTSIAMLPCIGDGHRSIETGSGECAGLARAMFRRACAGPVDARRVPFLERSGP